MDAFSPVMIPARSAAVQLGGSAAAVEAVPITVAPAATPAPMRLRTNIRDSLGFVGMWTLLNVDRYHLHRPGHPDELDGEARAGLHRRPSRRRNTRGRRSKRGSLPTAVSDHRRGPRLAHTRLRTRHRCSPLMPVTR